MESIEEIGISLPPREKKMCTIKTSQRPEVNMENLFKYQDRLLYHTNYYKKKLTWSCHKNYNFRTLNISSQNNS